MITKPRTKLKKRYYRSKGKRYYLKESAYMDLQQVLIYCKSCTKYHKNKLRRSIKQNTIKKKYSYRLKYI